MIKVNWKKANPELSEYLEEALEPFNCEEWKMFGQPAYFVDNNMFAGVFGDDLFIRLSKADREEILSSNDEALHFEPMGRRMKEYVVLPDSLYNHREDFDKWLNRSYDYVSSLPPKKTKKQRRSK